MTLQEFFGAHPKAALAFSGGVDSSYLLYAARQLGADVKAYYVKTAFQPEFEYQDALRLASQLGADIQVLTLDVLACPELRLLADTGTGVAHCPISNMKLSSGIARIPEMLALGVPVGLAVDGSASNDGSSLLEELRVAFLLHRLNSSRQAPTGYDMLKIATRGSARLLGRDDIGQLAEGKCADLFMLDSRRLELVGACTDPGSVLGTVGVRGAVDYTVVHGKITVRQGHLVTVDEARVAEEANRKCKAYLAQ